MKGSLDAWLNYYRDDILEINGKKFEVRSYGMCHWTKIIFLWPDGTEFYRIERDIDNGFGADGDRAWRREYFNGTYVRKYIAKKNCFIEFLDFAKDRMNEIDEIDFSFLEIKEFFWKLYRTQAKAFFL